MSAACDKTASKADKLKIYERGDKLLKQRTQGNWKNITNPGEKSAFIGETPLPLIQKRDS